MMNIIWSEPYLQQFLRKIPLHVIKLVVGPINEPPISDVANTMKCPNLTIRDSY